MQGLTFLQIKFLQGEQLTVNGTTNETQADENYFIAEQESAEFARGAVDSGSLKC
ncbi:hypothetical protein P4S68_22625 [Pseudoalteromonas sp. Hal099]